MTDRTSAFLRRFRKELLRWNRQMSLVSRLDTGKRVDALLKQSVDGADAISELLVDGLGADRGIVYCDLGSGGGIPGLVWHECLKQRFGERLLHTLLVEPRAKRAWFLLRSARLLELDDLGVFEGRWGESAVASIPPTEENPLWVLSMKALRLSDDEVAAAWLDAGEPRPETLICRYLPPGEGGGEPPRHLSTGGNSENSTVYLRCGRDGEASATLSVTTLGALPS